MTNPPATFYVRYGKRLLDLLVAFPALILLAPVLLLLAFLVGCFLGTPVLFRQQRTGFGKRPFTILKFRTMTNERDAAGELLPDSRRLTRFGKFLRSTSLDELPELLNVVMGDMSLVGPRPLMPQYDPYYSEREARRFEVLPGITGWAQINGRNDLAWDDRLECDACYVESCSFFLDLKILFLTVIKVLRRDNVQADPGLSVDNLDDERRLRAAQGELGLTRGEEKAAAT
jgi:lipopolysaccharide/colanic/teichoic acid biosynthesis glycosyltransferase